MSAELGDRSVLFLQGGSGAMVLMHPLDSFEPRSTHVITQEGSVEIYWTMALEPSSLNNFRALLIRRAA
jgi:hypothetical protein